MTNDLAEIRRALACLCETGAVHELRIPGTRQGTVSGYFDDFHELAQAAAAWSGKAPGVYVTLNPVRTDLLARASNHVVTYIQHTTSDTDILRRRWLAIDFDPGRPSGISATDAQHDAALARAREAGAWLVSEGWPEPNFADSGNGAHLLYRIDLPNDPASRELVKRTLEALAFRFTDDAVAVDLTTSNAARIWKLYGTVAAKGDSTPERPHRLARLLEVPAPVAVVSRSLLERLAAMAPQAPAADVRGNGRVSGFDLERWLTAHADSVCVVTSSLWNGGQRWILNPCPWNPEHTNRAAFIVRFGNGAIAAGCHHNGCAGKNWHALRDLVEPGWQPPPGLPPDSFRSLRGDIGNESNFAPRRAADVLAQEPAPVPWVWEPYLPEGGLALLVAFMKVGKTTLAYALALAVAQGRPFLGSPTKQGAVLILAVEEHPREVERRLRRFGMRPDDPIYVHSGRLDNSAATFQALRNFIAANRVKLLFLDTLARFWSVTDENDNAQVVREVSPLLDLARETGAAVVLVHHERKSGGEDGRSIRGGSALFGLVDQALLLDRRQGGAPTHRVLRALGRYDETPGEVILELVDDDYQKLGTADELDRAAATAKVWAALSEEPTDIAGLAKDSGLRQKAVRQVLKDLGVHVVREGAGVKNDPFTYRRRADNSIPSQPHPIGDERNSVSAAPRTRMAWGMIAAARPGASVDCGGPGCEGA